MKEKTIVTILCCIVLTFVFLNVDRIGLSGRKTVYDIQPLDCVKETEFIVRETEEGNFKLVEVSESDTELDTKPKLPLYSLAACMIDGKTGRVLFGKDEFQERAMASTTKILTCLVALENCSLDDIVTFSEYAASMPDVQLNARVGEQFRLYDLLLSLMLESHNDTAVAIAEHVGGTVDEFCNMMTMRAQKIGCTHSVFLTPNGLDRTTSDGSKKHSTTAYDLALIMRECIQNEQFVTICKTKNAMISNVNKTQNYQLTNHNALLNTMTGVIAGKTGFTCDAGYCYVGAVERIDSVFICALLGCGWPNNKNYKWYDMNVLVDYAQSEFHKIEVSNELIQDMIPKSISVYNGIINRKPCNTIEINVEKESSATQLMRKGERITVSYYLPESILAPVKEGEKVGEIRYIINGQTIKNESLTVMTTVEKINLKDYFKLLFEDYMLSGSLVSPSEKCSS